MSAKIHILKNSKKVRLDEFLRAEIPKILDSPVSNSKIRRLIFSGCVSVGSGETRNPSLVLFPNSIVRVFLDDGKFFFEKKPDDIQFELDKSRVLFEDEWLIAVDKPSHFPTERGIVEGRDSLHSAVVRYLFERQKTERPNAKNPPYAGIVHRLDRDTSGAILFTKSREVNAACHEMFESRKVEKKYLAVCSIKNSVKNPAKNPPQKKDFSVEFEMGRISPKGQAAKWGRVQSGVFSKTEFSVLGEGEFNGRKVVLVECRPLTGRTHQIRVHLASVGLPILGDTLYGGAPHERILLHAHTLAFPHPKTGEILKVEAPLPEDFCQRINFLI